MPRRRTEKNDFTTMRIRKIDKDLMRRFSEEVKSTNNGKIFEKDELIFAKIIAFYSQHHEKGEIHSTYSSKNPLDKSQQGS